MSTNCYFFNSPPSVGSALSAYFAISLIFALLFFSGLFFYFFSLFFISSLLLLPLFFFSLSSSSSPFSPSSFFVLAFPCHFHYIYTAFSPPYRPIIFTPAVLIAVIFPLSTIEFFQFSITIHSMHTIVNNFHAH